MFGVTAMVIQEKEFLLINALNVHLSVAMESRTVIILLNFVQGRFIRPSLIYENYHL